MKNLRLHFPISLLCRALQVSRSGFYSWLKRSPCKRTEANERLKIAIKVAHKRTRETYGVRRLQP